MFTIHKKFKGYPFAHRQHTHGGHCSLIHGHNWDFEIFLQAEQLDENGFVYDFGKFGWLKEYLEENFDHTCVINEDDPKRGRFESLYGEGLLELRIVPSCSSEGLAKLVFEEVQNHFKHFEDDRVQVAGVRVYEDYKNSAIYGR